MSVQIAQLTEKIPKGRTNYLKCCAIRFPFSLLVCPFIHRASSSSASVRVSSSSVDIRFVVIAVMAVKGSVTRLSKGIRCVIYGHELISGMARPNMKFIL